MENVDYQILSPSGGIVTFGPDIRTVNVSIQLFDDSLYEENESFRGNIGIPASPVSGLVLGRSSVTFTIEDNEGILRSFYAATFFGDNNKLKE